MSIVWAFILGMWAGAVPFAILAKLANRGWGRANELTREAVLARQKTLALWAEDAAWHRDVTFCLLRGWRNSAREIVWMPGLPASSRLTVKVN